MKGVTALLVGLLLMLGAETARAASDPRVNSTVVSANHADLLVAGPVSSVTLYPQADPNSGFNSDEVISSSQPINVLGYAVDKRVTINLECRFFDTAQYGSDLVSNINEIVDVEYIAQNLMLGFHYKF
jgi:hypothetical protein